MLPRCLIVCTLLLAPSLPVIGSPDVVHFARNISLSAEQRVHNVNCFLCSAEIAGRTTGSVRVFAGNVFLSGTVAGNVLVFGGNVSLTTSARIGSRVVIFGGHLFKDPAAASPLRTVLSPIIFLPVILLVCAVIGGLIVLTRRMAHGPVAYPPLPRL